MDKKKGYTKENEFLDNYDDEANILYGDKLNQQIGKEIKKLRLENNFSQEQFGSLIGTKKNNISKLENGKLNPSVQYLEKVANALNMNIEFLFKKKNNQPNL